VLALVALSLAAERRTPVVVAVERAMPAVVSLECEVQQTSPFLMMGGSYTATSDGSGVLIDADGVVLTNAHVVQGAGRITAQLPDGRTFNARVLGLEQDLDLAVLQLDDASGLPTVVLGTSSDLMLGETVIALGNPYGLDHTVSTGVVSTVSREMEIAEGVYQTYVQTDAAINPGNSGGALVNIDGDLIGVNTAVHSAGQGIGFAIPADRAVKVAHDLMRFGSVRAPWLGVDLVDVSAYKLRGTPLSEGAVQVSWVHDGGPAAGKLQKGDLLYKVDDRPIHSRADLNAFLAESAPGRSVGLDVYRGSSHRRVTLSTGAADSASWARTLEDVLGITLAPSQGGLVVETAHPQGAWVRYRLRVGDVIEAVDGRTVGTAEQLAAALVAARSSHRPSALFTVRRGRYRGNINLPI